MCFAPQAFPLVLCVSDFLSGLSPFHTCETEPVRAPPILFTAVPAPYGSNPGFKLNNKGGAKGSMSFSFFTAFPGFS